MLSFLSMEWCTVHFENGVNTVSASIVNACAITEKKVASAEEDHRCQ